MRLIFRILSFPLRLIWRALASKSDGNFWMSAPLVIDGDTLFYNGARIRIWGIDAPEMSERHGAAAKRQLAQLCLNRRIYVVPVSVDVYGRQVAKLFYGRGDIGQGMVASGYAISCCRTYRADQARSKRAKAGLWGLGGIPDPATHRKARAASA